MGRPVNGYAFARRDRSDCALEMRLPSGRGDFILSELDKMRVCVHVLKYGEA